MIDVPSGFIAIPTNEDGSYIPFFVKVRGEDIVWNGDNTYSYIKSVIDNDDVKTINPAIYKFEVPNTQKILIDTSNNVYFKKNDDYDKYSISDFKYYSIDVDNDNRRDSCYFIYGTPTKSNTPNINIVSSRATIIDYTWDCRINSDGFVSAQVYIPVCNYIIQRKNNINTYYCYSHFDYDRTVTYMDTLTLDKFKLPVPILTDSLNIQISKKSDLKEFTNTFIGSSVNTNTMNITYDGQSYSFNTAENITVELNGINKITDSDSFAYILKNCGIYINITGYIPMIEN